MQNFKKIRVWQKAHQLCLLVYEVTVAFPKEEKYGLVDQMRRAASSAPANIAEGSAASSPKVFARHLEIALGSLSELEYFSILARDLELVSAEKSVELIGAVVEVRRMLVSFRSAVRHQLTRVKAGEAPYETKSLFEENAGPYAAEWPPEDHAVVSDN